MTTAIFATLLHEDPRYYQLGRGRFEHRAYHAINRCLLLERIQATAVSISRKRWGMPRLRHSPISTMHRRIVWLAKRQCFCPSFLYDGMNNELKESGRISAARCFIRTRRSFTLSYCSMDSCAVAHLWVIWTQRKKNRATAGRRLASNIS